MYLLDSVFGEGLWLIPVISLAGVIWSAFRVYNQMKGGSVWTEYPPFGKPIEHTSDERPNPFKLFATWTGIVCLAIFIATILTK